MTASGARTPELLPPPDRPRRSYRRPLAISGLVLAVAAAWLVHRDRAGDESAAARVVTAPADRGAIQQTVSATGTVNPVKTVQVGTYVSGPILAIDADFNATVTQGQRVAEIDPAPFLVKVRESDANVANARAKVEKDRADLALKKLLLQRNQPLFATGVIAQTDLDTARSNYDQAVAQLALDQAAVAQAEAMLEEAQVNLRYTDILSPVDGVVVSRNVDVGQTVAASFQTPTLFLIAKDLTKMQVDTNVSESDVGHVREGQPVSFTVDAYPGEPFTGRVAQVRNAPITVQNVVTYDVVIAVDNPELKLKPGMTANVTITTARRDDVLRVPARALRFRPEGAAASDGRRGGGTSVWVVDAGGGLRRVDVRVGIRDAQHAEVVGDLKAGDKVAVGSRPEPDAATPQSQPPSFSRPHRF